jgi:hypothetical protein
MVKANFPLREQIRIGADQENAPSTKGNEDGGESHRCFGQCAFEVAELRRSGAVVDRRLSENLLKKL